MIDFEEEIERFKPSLDVEEVEDAIVKSDLTDMTDIMMELIKEREFPLWEPEWAARPSASILMS